MRIISSTYQHLNLVVNLVVKFNNCTITSTNFMRYKILKYIFIYQFIALLVSHTQGKMTIRDKKIITFNTAERWWKTNHHLVHLPWQNLCFCKVKISKCITIYYKLKFEDFYNPFCKHIFVLLQQKIFLFYFKLYINLWAKTTISIQIFPTIYYYQSH